MDARSTRTECADGPQPSSRRLAAIMFPGPFILGAVWAGVAAGQNNLSAMFVTLAAAFAIAAVAAIGLTLAVPFRRLGSLSLVMMAGLIAWTIAGAGGLASPLLVLAVALPLESWWVARKREALMAGLAAAVAVVCAQPLLATGMSSTFSAWHWLMPLAYVASVALRWQDFLVAKADAAAVDVSIEDMLDAAIIRLDRTGNVIDAAGKSSEFLGVSPNLLLGEGLFDRVHVADRVVYLRALSLVRGGAAQQFDLRLRVATDGDPMPVYTPFAAELYSGNPDVLILRQNQQVETLRADVERLREELVKADIGKAAFLATVSHELRTPLNAIIGFSDMLGYEMVGRFTDPRQHEYTTLIRESGSHLLGVVNAILDISRIESRAYSIRTEPFAFAEAAACCHAMLAMQAQVKSVELHNNVLPAIGEVNADRRAVQQILINLIGNAVKFTPNGGTVRLEARRNARTITFEVHDNGIGMSADDLARVGRPFVQVSGDYSRDHDGVGLGLSIAKGLVALHGGAMAISSAPGAGTVVSVTLPLDGAGAQKIEHQNTVLQEEHGDGPFRKSA